LRTTFSGAEKVAETLTRMGLPTSTMEASLLFTRYHRRFPSIRRVTQEYKKFLIEHKYIENLYGRRYYLNTRDGYKGLNYVCQGSPADLMKRAMVKIWKWLRRRGLRSKILIQVHDELVVQIPRSEEAEVVPKIVELMQDLESFYVPITVGVEVSKTRWSHKQEFDVERMAIVTKKVA
jgi:DNA polymerase-1